MESNLLVFDIRRRRRAEVECSGRELPPIKGKDGDEGDKDNKFELAFPRFSIISYCGDLGFPFTCCGVVKI